MKTLIFFDTETTSDVNGRLVQLGARDEAGSGIIETYKPAVPIEYEAMAVHGITNRKADQMAPFDDGAREFVRALFAGKIAVAHNAPFDVAVMAREGVEIPEWIDTLKVARRLLPEWPNHKLQYLRYRLGIEVDAGPAHDALADVQVLIAIFEKMRQIMDETRRTDEQIDPVETMLRWSHEPAPLHAVTFGKYKGKTWEEVAKDDIQYLYWLQRQDCDEDLRFTIESWIKRFSRSIAVPAAPTDQQKKLL